MYMLCWIFALLLRSCESVNTRDFYPFNPGACTTCSSTPCITDLVRPDLGTGLFLETSSFPGDGSDCPRQYAWDDLRSCHVDENIENGEPIGGSHGSCRYRYPGSPTFDDCEPWIYLDITDASTGLPVFGTTPTWSCQGVAYNQAVTEPSTSAGLSDGTSTYFCSCNLNTLVGPNGGRCLELCAETNDQRIMTQTVLGGGNPAIDRRGSFILCDSSYQHWRASGALPIPVGDTRDHSTIVDFGGGPLTYTFTEFAVLRPNTLVSSTPEDTLVASCSRVVDDTCANVGNQQGGIPSYLYYLDRDFVYTFSNLTTRTWHIHHVVQWNKWAPCYSSVRGTPGCGLDVIPCICHAGYFGDTCQYKAWDDAYCDYDTTASIEVILTFTGFNVSKLCRDRGTCAGGAIDITYQDPKSAAYSTSIMKCTSCDDGFYGDQCQVTCGSTNAPTGYTPQCPSHASCVNNGTQSSPVARCQCDSGYRDPNNDGQPDHPTQDNTTCLTCTNELSVDVPTCNGHGVCPISTYTCYNYGCSVPAGNRPTTPLRCTCDAGYIDLACAIPSIVTFSCGAAAIQVDCNYTSNAGGTVYYYECSWSDTLHTGTTPDQLYPSAATCTNVVLTDADYLSATSQLRLLGNDDACLAIAARCAIEHKGNIFDEPFRDVNRAPTFGDPPATGDYLVARPGSNVTLSVFCWKTVADPERYVCKTPPINPLPLVLYCELPLSWSVYSSSPNALWTVIKRECKK